MARAPRATEDAQMDLVNVLPENVKEIRKLIRQRDAAHEKHLEKNREAKELEGKIWELVQASGGKLDSEGKLRLKIAEDEVLEIKRAEAKLTVSLKAPKKKGADDEDEDGGDEGGDEDDGEELEGNEPPLTKRSGR